MCHSAPLRFEGSVTLFAYENAMEVYDCDNNFGNGETN
jgi:hypothetical protein